MNKPAIDPVTGCAHIRTLKTYKVFRVCSVCEAEMPKEIIEDEIKFCWRCGNMFDHTDDDPREDDNK